MIQTLQKIKDFFQKQKSNENNDQEENENNSQEENENNDQEENEHNDQEENENNDQDKNDDQDQNDDLDQVIYQNFLVNFKNKSKAKEYLRRILLPKNEMKIKQQLEIMIDVYRKNKDIELGVTFLKNVNRIIKMFLKLKFALDFLKTDFIQDVFEMIKISKETKINGFLIKEAIDPMKKHFTFDLKVSALIQKNAQEIFQLQKEDQENLYYLANVLPYLFDYLYIYQIDFLKDIFYLKWSLEEKIEDIKESDCYIHIKVNIVNQTIEPLQHYLNLIDEPNKEFIAKQYNRIMFACRQLCLLKIYKNYNNSFEDFQGYDCNLEKHLPKKIFINKVSIYSILINVTIRLLTHTNLSTKQQKQQLIIPILECLEFYHSYRMKSVFKLDCIKQLNQHISFIEDNMKKGYYILLQMYQNYYQTDFLENVVSFPQYLDFKVEIDWKQEIESQKKKKREDEQSNMKQSSTTSASDVITVQKDRLQEKSYINEQKSNINEQKSNITEKKNRNELNERMNILIQLIEEMNINFLFASVIREYFDLCCDPIAQVRTAAAYQIYHIFAKLPPRSPQSNIFYQALIEIVNSFYFSSTYSLRQTFIVMCSALMSKNPKIFLSYFSDKFYFLAKDRVINVRITLAIAIAGHINTNQPLSNHKTTRQIVNILKQDLKQDVKSIVAEINFDQIQDEQDYLEEEEQEEQEEEKEEEKKINENDVQNNVQYDENKFQLYEIEMEEYKNSSPIQQDQEIQFEINSQNVQNQAVDFFSEYVIPTDQENQRYNNPTYFNQFNLDEDEVEQQISQNENQSNKNYLQLQNNINNNLEDEEKWPQPDIDKCIQIQTQKTPIDELDDLDIPLSSFISKQQGLPSYQNQ